ncbi:L-tyrosine decarboxylase [Psilocybe cubensis]|uniref:L-tyrosine decarboxylase n=2 Tax=Psilocybe cubensis TaxID=181762 RepID=A0ACB8H3A3_PSICU|nr:L-tyrosine decarboxylase [Psilocybe cubensis]KAH9482182.1 L-tyrosine decarboxylase [Psilocybe cubensis]
MSAENTIAKPRYRIPTSEDHERTSALFLGPKAENAKFLREWLMTVVSQQEAARHAYSPKDNIFISAATQSSKAFRETTNAITSNLTALLTELGQKSVPFYSPRYSGHMSVDQSLPAILGYLSTLFYNPNNVAFEASPFTTIIEGEVGLQLSEMLGYNRLNNVDEPLAWGHIASGGTVANLESMWAGKTYLDISILARNLKFYPLSLRNASAKGAELEFIADTFSVKTCVGDEKLLKDCSMWELFNLHVTTILDLPDRLNKEYRISGQFLEKVMRKYIIQSTNKDVLMQNWQPPEKLVQPVVLSPSTNHYSWPKAAAVLGIGSDNLRNVPVDMQARMDINELDRMLQRCLDEKTPVYQVVAVIGTTEEGGIDRITEVLRLRKKYQALGLSFAIHADAAWGGYFATMLPRPTPYTPGQNTSLPADSTNPDFVPYVGLRPESALQLSHIKFADSITVDPHKAGYIPYPAGALCYRDGRMRHLLTWSAPYLIQGNEGQSIGIYGIEGSKPGAAASAVFMAHGTIGINGYGSLLGQAMFTCRRYAAHWSAMSTDSTSFTVTPFNPIPADVDPNADPAKVEEQKQFIRDRILFKSNEEIYNDSEAMELLHQLGSDLNINVFACNFRDRDGNLNIDVEEANWLNNRIFQRFSVTSAEENPLDTPFFLSSTTLKQSEYGVCAAEVKRRMGLVGDQDVIVLRNVVMSPFTATNDFVGTLANTFQKIVEEEVEYARIRNDMKPSIHTFLLHGSVEQYYLVHTPTIHMASGRRQIILSVDITGTVHQAIHADEQVEALIIHNTVPLRLDDIVDGASFEGILSIGKRQTDIKVNISNIKVVKKRSLMTEDLESAYPSLMPFYFYGTQKHAHIDHVITVVPNIHLSAGRIEYKFDDDLSSEDLAKGLIVVAENVHEASMQPFPLMKDLHIDDQFFFNSGQTLHVKVYRDPYPASTMDPIPLHDIKNQPVVTQGTITLVGNLYVDSDALNVASEPTADDDARAASQARNMYGEMTAGTIKGWQSAVRDFHNKLETIAPAK